MARLLGEDVEDSQSEDFQRMNAEQQRILVQDILTRYGIVPKARAEHETANLLEVFTRNVQAMESYRLSRTEQRILFLAASQAEAPEELVENWRPWAAGGVDFRPVPGNHYTILKRPNVTAIAEVLRRAIDEFAERSSSAAEVRVGSSYIKPKKLLKTGVTK
jgi:thioesterase domain-containing protein